MAPLYISQLLTPYTAPGSLRERINYCYRFHSLGLKPCFHCFSSALLKRLPPTIRSAHLKEKNPLYIRDIPSLWHHIDTRVKTKRVKQFKPKLLMIVVTCGDYWAHSWNFGCIEYTLLKHDKSKTHSSASVVSPFSFTETESKWGKIAVIVEALVTSCVKWRQHRAITVYTCTWGALH